MSYTYDDQKKSLVNYQPTEAANASLGQGGCVILAGTAPALATGPFMAITALTGGVSIDVSECDMSWIDGISANDGSAANIIIPAGMTIFGKFKSIKMIGESANDQLIAYKG